MEKEEAIMEIPKTLGFKVYESEQVYKDFEYLMERWKDRVFNNQSNLFRLIITKAAEQERKEEASNVGMGTR